jgi:hypothetical protein
MTNSDNDYLILKAAVNDVDFITEVITGAEMSFNNNLSLARLFDLPEEKIRKLIRRMLLQEVDGCEFSLSSFFIAWHNNKPVGALCGWPEGYYNGMSSNLLRSNLINQVFAREDVLKAQLKMEAMKDLLLPDRPAGSYQIGYNFINGAFQDGWINSQLLEAHRCFAKELNPHITAMQISCFETNQTGINMHLRNGFKVIKKSVYRNEGVLRYMPHNIKVLLEKAI